MLGTAALSAMPARKTHTFTAGEGTFLLDGKPYVIKAAELHYPRIPRQYWDQRIKMCRALGMNTICMYVFWNIHEQEPGKFDFTGQNDVAEFITMCQNNGMNVILRPGPYVCAEWEMGGLPWWLLQKEDIRLREDDPYFMERVDMFQKALADEIGGYTIQNGGPIIMVQVENEYGSYGKDKEYVGKIRDTLRKYWGDEVTMFQCDWSSNFLDNGLDDLVWTLNFGTGADIDSEFAPLRRERPDAPLMCSEFWSGWFDKWGANHETRPAEAMTAGIDEMLSKGISFSLYMTHGGTNWGHWAGANSPGYAPDVTSYDYDAPINEQGAPTPKYDMLRQVMARHNNLDVDGYMTDIPPVPPTGDIKPFNLTEVAPLFHNLPPATHHQHPLTMEALGQGFGSVMYSTTLPAVKEGAVLTVTEPHDYAQVFVNGERVGTLDRRLNQKSLTLPASAGGRLDILVEATGRINFGRAIKDYKGITEDVRLDNVALTGWDIRLLPDKPEFYEQMTFVAVGDSLPAGVYRGTFNVDTPTDTFLDFETWGKGLVYVNGHALGRIWNIGPQQTLYMPGCWLREGENEIMVFDIIGPAETRVAGLYSPIDNVVTVADAGAAPTEIVDVEKVTVAEGTLKPGNGWQRVTFSPVEATCIGFEFDDSHDGGDAVAIAEIYLLDADGNRLPREKWSIAGGSSADTAGNHTPDKVFDLQESTYWQSAPGHTYPHEIVFDLGESVTVGGFEILPRMEKGAPAAPRTYRLIKL